MTVKPSQTVVVNFSTSNPSTGGLENADSTPTGTFSRNGTDDGAVTVTVTNVSTGRYKASFTIPSGAAAGDTCTLWISAVLGGVTGGNAVWGATVDTERVSDLNDLDAAGVRAAVGLGSANLDTQLGTIVADTNELQTDWANGGRLDNILDARASQASVDDVPTNSELTTALAAADDAVLSAIDALPTAAEITTAVLTTVMTESYRTAGQAPTLAQAQFELIAHPGNSAIAGPIKTLNKLDGTTPAKTFTLNDANTPTAITETT